MYIITLLMFVAIRFAVRSVGALAREHGQAEFHAGIQLVVGLAAVILGVSLIGAGHAIITMFYDIAEAPKTERFAAAAPGIGMAVNTLFWGVFTATLIFLGAITVRFRLSRQRGVL